MNIGVAVPQDVRRTNLGAMANVEGEGRNGGECGLGGQSTGRLCVYGRIRFRGWP